MTGGTEIEKRSDDTEIAELDAELQRARQEAEELIDLGAPSTGTELVHVGSSGAATKRDLARRKQQLAKKRAEVEAISKRMRTAMETRMSEAMAIIDPLRKMVKQLEEGIWMVNLYLGRDEQIVTLRDGEPASADTPIHIRQLVLSMDEETAIDPEAGGLDFQDIDLFDEWITESDQHIKQVIPDVKGVVAIRPRAERTKDYGNAFADNIAAREDKHTYFLIRNGERLYRLWTEFTVFDTMVPKSNEFTEMFQRDRYNFDSEEDEIEELEPGTMAFERASEEAEAAQRHFMRVGLVLQGLVDRTAVFHPLPEAGVNFLTAESHNEGTVKFIMDAEQTIDTGREPFRVWQRRINSELRPGMRVVGAFNGEAFRNSNRFERRYGHSQLSPEGASYPDSLVPLTIDSRKPDGSLAVKYKRTDKKYDYYEGAQEYKRRASVELHPEDEFIIAIDFADADLMEEYLRSRVERHEYLDMFPLLKAAIMVKRAEAEAEAPFLKLITAQLVVHNDVSIEQAQKVVPSLVQWWKFKNRQHRALTGTGEDRKALTEIVAEHAKRQKLDRTATPPELLKQLERTHPNALLIARRSDGKHVVLKPENDEDVFVAIGVYNRNGKVLEQKRWKLPPPSVLSWRAFYESPRWKRWRRGASLSDYLTGPEIEGLANSLVNPETIAVTYDPRSRKMEEWRAEKVSIPRKARVRHERVDGGWPQTSHRWYRENGVAKLREHDYWDGAPVYTGPEPWQPSARARYGEKRILLYENRELIEKTHERLDRAKAVEVAGRELESTYRRAIRSLLSQHAEAVERKAYQDFLAEYADPELWEGHKKTLNDPERPDELNNPEYLIPLIEEGREITGLTLGEAAALTGAEVTDEYAGLVINAEPEPEPESDPEEEDDDDYDD